MTRSSDKPAGQTLPGVKRQTRARLALPDKNPGQLLQAFPGLPAAEQLRLLLFAPALLRQELLLTVSHAEKLVALLPAQEAFFTVKEIGFPDARPFLRLMSSEQLQFLSDLETWEKDDLSPGRFLELLRALHSCGEDHLARWIETLDPEVMVVCLGNCGRVTKFNVFQDQVEEPLDPEAITLDGVYFFHPYQPELRPLLASFFRILKARREQEYDLILESMVQELRAEIEEEALRLRAVRLEQRGIPDFESACEIYRPLSDERFHNLVARLPAAESQPSSSPLYPVRWLPSGSFLGKALRTLSDHPQANRIRMELAVLGNKVLIADGLELKDPDVVRYALKKMAGYLNIALESLSGGSVADARDWILKTWLQFLFQKGYTRVHELAAEAKRTIARAGFRWFDRIHCLAESPLEETLRGLLRRRPLFYVGVSEENWIGFREFSCQADIRTAAERIAATNALADLFLQIDLSPPGIKESGLKAGLGDTLDSMKWSQVLHTLWVRRALGAPMVFQPLSQAELSRFRSLLMSEAAGPGLGNRLHPKYRRGLLAWLRQSLPGLPNPVMRLLKDWALAGCLRVEQDLGGLAPGREVDPRFVQAVCVRRPPA